MVLNMMYRETESRGNRLTQVHLEGQTLNQDACAYGSFSKLLYRPILLQTVIIS